MFDLNIEMHYCFFDWIRKGEGFCVPASLSLSVFVFYEIMWDAVKPIMCSVLAFGFMNIHVLNFALRFQEFILCSSNDSQRNKRGL